MTATQPHPLPANTLLDDLHPARFLKPADLLDRWKVRSIVVEVVKVQVEETEPKPGQKESQPVLYFKTKTGETFPRGFLLAAKVNVESIKASTGATTIGDLIGKKIKIIVGEHKGRAVLRIDPQPV